MQYGKCGLAGVYPFEMMFQEEALKVEESLNDKFLHSFVACIGCVET